MSDDSEPDATQPPWWETPVERPDAGAASTLAGRVAAATEDGAGWGALATAAGWLAAVQGQPVHGESAQDQPLPRMPRLARVLVIGAGPSGGVDAVAAVQGLEVRCVDVAAGSTEDALAAGADLLDEELAAGTDLVLLGSGPDHRRSAAVVIAAALGRSTLDVRPWPRAGGDEPWMADTEAVRDALRGCVRQRHLPLQLLAAAEPGGQRALAVTTGLLIRAAQRSVPVVLGGLGTTAAALIADRLAPGCARWMLAAHASPEPGHTLALAALRLEPLLPLALDTEDGTGAVAALPLLTAGVTLANHLA